MLEKPDIQERLIISRLQDEYGLHITQVTFLPRILFYVIPTYTQAIS